MKCFEKNNVPPGYTPVEGSKCSATEEECAKSCRKCTMCAEFWDFAYFDVVQTKNYKDSFRIEYGSLNTDSPPDLSFNGQALQWEGDNSDLTQEWGRIAFAAIPVSSPSRRVVSVSAGRFFANAVYGMSVSQECDVVSGVSILDVSTNVADEIRHIAEDGTETVWTKTSSDNSSWNRSILIQDGEESPYRTGVYLMDEQPGSFPVQAISINLLSGERQIFPTIDSECPPNPVGRTMSTKTTGPGTHLKNMLGWVGIRAKEKGCKCGHMEKKMNQGPQWCRDHKEEILDHLAKEAKKRGLLFVRLAAEKLVDLAIRRAERG